MKTLIGYTGLVGTTLLESIEFDYLHNSKNLHEVSKETHTGSDLYLACLPATKWLVNKDPAKDLDNIYSILSRLETVAWNKIYLISTIDIYGETSKHATEVVKPVLASCNYGSNRYLFEELCKSRLEYTTVSIYRLPALFNKRIKKNVLYDLIHNNRVKHINSNTAFQWYNLDNLAGDILKYNDKGTVNLFTEPIETIDILALFPEHIDAVSVSTRFEYDYKTCLSSSGYISSAKEVLQQIKETINEISN